MVPSVAILSVRNVRVGGSCCDVVAKPSISVAVSYFSTDFKCVELTKPATLHAQELPFLRHTASLERGVTVYARLRADV
jgi:hypothetical protein